MSRSAPDPDLGSGMPVSPELVAFARQLREDFGRLQMESEFAIDEVLTKVSILRKEFMRLHRYNPIEHVGSRLKTPSSTLQKAMRLGIEPSPVEIRKTIKDIAGVRITCSFIADTYRVMQALTSQSDVKVVTVKDYIANPKPNGYKSLHLIVEVPVFLSTGPVNVPVEVQIRTIAMDFWASLEHKIYYKYKGEVPGHLLDSLTEAAKRSDELDQQMEQLHEEVQRSGPGHVDHDEPYLDEQLLLRLWAIRNDHQGAPEAPTT